MKRSKNFAWGLLLLSSMAMARSQDYCTSKKLDWITCQQQIRDGSRSSDLPCSPVPKECSPGGGGSEGCASRRLDYITCLQNARDAGLEPSVCGREPSCN